MVFAPDERMKKRMQRDGSVLKYMYSAAGTGRGLFAGGLLSAGIGIVLYVVLIGIDGLMAFRLGAAFLIPGLLILVGGIILQNNRMGKWLEVLEEKTGLPKADILRADREFKEPGTVLLSFENGTDSNSLKKMGFLTESYLKMPGVAPFLYRIEDMVACFYTDQFACRDGGYDEAFVAYSTNKEKLYLSMPAPKEAAKEIIKMIERCNPMLITTHFFAYEGRRYDAVKGFEDVIDLHNQILEQRMNQEAEQI